MFLLKRKTFIEVVSLWLKTKTEVKVQSLQKYENMIHSYIYPYFKDILISEIKIETITSFMEKLKQENISVSTLKMNLFIIRSTLQFAYQKKYCSYINLDKIKIPKSTNVIFILSKEEQKVLESALKDKVNIRKVCLLLCLYTGLRVGEVCGLKWEDINLQAKTLQVKRTIQRIKNEDSSSSLKTKLIISTPKSDTSNRIIPIPDFLIELLKRFEDCPSYFLLSKDEKLYDPRLLESFYERILKQCKIRNHKFHTLRHTFATRAIEANIDIKTLSEILGHASVDTTLKIYIHPSLELKKNSLETLVSFMKDI